MTARPGSPLTNGWKPEVTDGQRKVYIDTAVFLEHFLGQERADDARASIEAAEAGSVLGHISALVLAETIGTTKIRAPQHIPSKERHALAKKVRDYFDGARLRYVDITQRAGNMATGYALKHEVRRTTHLR